MQRQMPPSVYRAIQNALQAAILDAQQQQQQWYAMANLGYYPNVTGAFYQTSVAPRQQPQQQQQQPLSQQQQEQQQEPQRNLSQQLIQQQLQQQQHLEEQQWLQQVQQMHEQVQQLLQQRVQQQVQQLQQQQRQEQYTRQAQMYQNYPTQAYAMPYSSQALYQQAPYFAASRSYGAAQTGYPPNGPTGYSASWPGASTSAERHSRSPWATYQQATGFWEPRRLSPQNADAGRQNYYCSNTYPRRSRYPPGFRFFRPNNPAGYQTQSYRQRYPPPGVYQVQPRYPQNR
ncbi:uncharacterized protein LOC142776278 [Rhipicephalus microplus]|uniref:uncharacterized protein LOC142776278 n=1 Tax=Rhipicephalus microplus TaxID=6941 RepID=UPI003F6CE243